eukprot:2802745-Amphidinium_carterae.1
MHLLSCPSPLATLGGIAAASARGVIPQTLRTLMCVLSVGATPKSLIATTRIVLLTQVLDQAASIGCKEALRREFVHPF